jgi:DnaK suppressor protein
MPAKKSTAKAPSKAKKAVVAPKPVPAKKAVPDRKAASTPKTSTPIRKDVAKTSPAAPPVAARTESTVSKTATRPASKSKTPSPAIAETSKEVIAQGIRIAPLPPPSHDDGEDGSLLAGPRNVQPYIAKRGEQYMSTEQLEHFRRILSSWKRDLMEEVDRTVSHMKDEASNFPDPNDRATQEEEFSLELRTRDRERKLIRKIDEALKRIDDGSYGYCLETGEEIGIKRLEARPVATLNIEAQERRERREKQYGDRDDRYR